MKRTPPPASPAHAERVIFQGGENAVMCWRWQRAMQAFQRLRLVQKLQACEAEVTRLSVVMMASSKALTGTVEEIPAQAGEVPVSLKEVTGQAGEVPVSREEVFGRAEEVPASSVQVAVSPKEGLVSREEVFGLAEEVSASSPQVAGSLNQVSGSSPEVAGSSKEVLASPAEVSASSAEVRRPSEAVSGRASHVLNRSRSGRCPPPSCPSLPGPNGESPAGRSTFSWRLG